jgi:hypothetical protein
MVQAEDGAPHLAEGEVVTLIGKQKSKKSFFAYSYIAASQSTIPVMGMLGTDEEKVALIFDTEQGKHHINRGMRTIKQLNPSCNFRAFSLKKYLPTERLEKIERILSSTPNVGVVLIDGVRDLLFDILSSEDSVRVVSKLLTIGEEHKCSIVCVLHENKKDNNARGHIGSELMNKSSAIVRVTKDEQAKHISHVECVASRDKEFQTFSFTLTMEGGALVPTITEGAIGGIGRNLFKEFAPETHYDILESVFKHASTRKYAEIVDIMKGKYKGMGVDRVTLAEVRYLLTSFVEVGWVVKVAQRGGYCLGTQKTTIEFEI